ncbi:serine/threonine-protein kinase [Tuwongella immobilis]|uniref:Protein kinase domain-containing protein n=1 Tax=Tuwongella immobilis TaxID=692036 RepID=A0A6C2YIA1_9BACT|nr:serine/threonine-protein kinase [Tuwongella immobilis]VIP00722.1 serine threonine protein kinase : Putative serine/threonine-protein kinase PrkC OS=Mitsuokella sp. oral taxon 131 str. W9106 GN=HMPREF1985_02219 PE=4 SV=1: Pkinase [Tuwongella immobilis]VTR96862.1 serine threonine protein kinase : Putative serine/threonine-protein kinase PrkC OS=Mitsuokella sp. oral taxon 131 str. W9106 GN=HMPREF1985_02219 PE=4 SV=1: Pkinase [Tuwongella immobilis]
MPSLLKIVNFVVVSAVDLLLPDFIDKPIRVCQHFYRHFLATSPNEQLQLLAEGRELSAAQIDDCVQQILAGWKAALPPGESLHPQASILAWEMVQALCKSASSSQPAETLRKTLNETTLRRTGASLAAESITPEQARLGRLLLTTQSQRTKSASATKATGPLPQVPGYRLERLLGSGGFAQVFLAQQEATGEWCAVKVGALLNETRFRRESSIALSLQSPRLAQCFEAGTIAGDLPQFWLAMEYLPGRTLAEILSISHARPDAETALAIACEILQGLAAMHQKGLIHRDLKPENIMIDDRFSVKLIDFGLARPIEELSVTQDRPTIAGDLLGTPFYMSPEQADGDVNLTPTTDLWSFGIVVYELLVGKLPFTGRTIMAVGREIHTRDIDWDQPAIPAELRPILKRCTQRDVAKRPNIATAIVTDLQRAVENAEARLRQDRLSGMWDQLVASGLLEKLVVHWHGQLPENALDQVARQAAKRGIPEIDRKRVAKVLKPLCDAQLEVETSNRRLVELKQQLSSDLVGLSGAQLQIRSQEVQSAESVAEKAQRKFDSVVKKSLGSASSDTFQSSTQSQNSTSSSSSSGSRKRLPLIFRVMVAIAIFGIGCSGITIVMVSLFSGGVSATASGEKKWGAYPTTLSTPTTSYQYFPYDVQKK